MRLLIAYSFLVKQELQNKGQIDIHSTVMELMETDSNSTSKTNSNSTSIIDLTGDDDTSVAEFVSKTLEVVDLCCSSSSDSSDNLLPSELMPCGLIQDQSDSDIPISGTSLSSSGTGGRSGVPHPQPIGTLVKFCCNKSQEEEEEEEFSQRLGTAPFFLDAEHL